MIARDMQRAGAGLRSIAEPVVDTTSDFAELVLAILGVAAKLAAPAEGGPQAPRSWRDAASVARSYNVSQSTISRLAIYDRRRDELSLAEVERIGI